ncbi:MAG: SH3 domain-containing protein [Clostridia bacterium]|nr:SH3 domain-containing protein [Clostridia bacterium]MBQ7047719.1 SH3 domain-containing protein [Clostridia bacterium]
MASVFLSPSTQEYNLYYDGNGNEELYMNLVADEIEPYLTASGISFGRNDPSGRVSDSVAASNSGNYGLHLALHSNAAGSGNAGNVRGIDVYYYRDSPSGKAMAEILAENLRSIYPGTVRTVPNTSFAELRSTRAPAILAELGYHDNPEDAEWIKANISALAREISRSVAEFLNVPLVSPDGESATEKGLVSTGGGRLNIREAPTTSSAVIGQAPNGSTLDILGREGEWYRVRRGNLRGYVFGQYIKIL